MNLELWALDRYDQIARITDFTRVEVIERDLGEGAWLVEMPLGDASGPGAAMLAATWPGIELFDAETGWRFGGYLTSYRVIVDEDGTQTLRLMGSDFQSDLAAWLEWPEVTTPDEWWAVTVGGTIPLTSDLQNTVKFNAGYLAAPNRAQIDGMIFGPDPAAGTPKSRRLKGEPLLAVAKYLLWGTSWTARLRLVRSASDGAPSLLFETPERPLSTIVLDAKLGTAGRVEHGVSAATATWVVAMGDDVEPVVTAGERLVAISSQVESDWRFRHREIFINRPATDDFDALADEALTEVLANRYQRSALVDSARVTGYGRDIDLGWLVDVHLGPTFTPSTMRLPVVASTLTFTPGPGWERTVDVGAETPRGPGAVYAAIARTRAVARQLENDLRT